MNIDGKDLTNISNASFGNSVKLIDNFKDYQKSPTAIRNSADESERAIYFTTISYKKIWQTLLQKGNRIPFWI